MSHRSEEGERAQSREHEYERDFELAAAQGELERTERLLEGWRKMVRELEEELVDGETKLVQAELKAERLDAALSSIRAGRAYKLMRILWWIRRPLRRK